MAQAKFLESSLTPLLLSYSVCNPPAGLVDSTFNLYPECEHFSPTLVPPPWLKTQSPSPWIAVTAFTLAALTQLWVPSIIQHKVILLNHKQTVTLLTTLQKSLTFPRVKQSPYNELLDPTWHEGCLWPHCPFLLLSPTSASQFSLGQVRQGFVSGPLHLRLLLPELGILFPKYLVACKFNPCRSLTLYPILSEAFHYYTVSNSIPPTLLEFFISLSSLFFFIAIITIYICS